MRSSSSKWGLLFLPDGEDLGGKRKQETGWVVPLFESSRIVLSQGHYNLLPLPFSSVQERVEVGKGPTTVPDQSTSKLGQDLGSPTPSSPRDSSCHE